MESSGLRSLRHRDFRTHLLSRFLVLVSYQMLLVAVSQKVYETTRNPLHLGAIGLCLFLPKILFTLPAGHAADRYDRRMVMLVSRYAMTVVVLGLLYHFGTGSLFLPVLYGLLFLMGVVASFGGPASQAIVTQMVPERDFENAVAWISSTMQAAFVIGPALGGWTYALWRDAFPVLGIVAVLFAVSTFLLHRIRPRTDHIAAAGMSSEVSWNHVVAGLRYVFRNKLLLGTLSLDLFAVLFGGAVALMPVYANDILKVGPSGLGILRAAPAFGAAITAVILANRPPMRRAGMTMLLSVGLFGAATVIFGLSRHFILSMICLVILGASDMVSVMVRHVLVQVKTPPELRGRVSAVNLIFIGASNELGEFESGLTARWFGTVPAVVLGGLGTLTVVSLWAWRFPEIRNLGRLRGPHAVDADREGA